MNTFTEDFAFSDELSPELLEIKAELDRELEDKLNAIDAMQHLNWVQKQKATAEAQQAHDDALSKCLTDAGVVVRPMFEDMSRTELISQIKKSGRNYNFAKYTNAQLYRMWQRIQNELPVKKSIPQPKHDLDLDFDDVDTVETKQCDFCGTPLNTLDQCPICDLGDEDLWLDEDIFDNLYSPPTRSNWKSAAGQTIKLTQTPSTSTTTSAQSAQTPSPHLPSGRYAVRIVSHGGRLRALATDGVHPAAWVAFPNDLRQFEGQQYEVDQLIWNGKNYRVAGNIVEI